MELVLPKSLLMKQIFLGNMIAIISKIPNRQICNGWIMKMVIFHLLNFVFRLPNFFLEHFQVWMRAAGLSKFKKLWGRILDPLPEGNYQVIIYNRNKKNLRNGCQIFELSKPSSNMPETNRIAYSLLKILYHSICPR